MDTIISAKDPGRFAALAALAIGIVLYTLTPPLAQPQAYHAFADARTLAGIPHFWNVVSNVPFVVAGVLGLLALARQPRGVLPLLRPAYRVFFVGAILVGAGSAAYHVDPSDATLVIDRLPMAIAFMAFVAIVVGEHVGERSGARALAPLVALGVLSVLYWHATGDLRPYVLVQFVPLLAVPVVLWRRPSRLDSIAPLGAARRIRGCEAVRSRRRDCARRAARDGRPCVQARRRGLWHGVHGGCGLQSPLAPVLASLRLEAD